MGPRFFVTGGTGKTTTAEKLKVQLALPIVHLDSLTNIPTESSIIDVGPEVDLQDLAKKYRKGDVVLFIKDHRIETRQVI